MSNPQAPVSATHMTDLQAAQLCEVFAQGLDSGLNYARIMSFLERKGLGGPIASNLNRALLEDGLRISEAFARHGILDPTARKLIYVAEDQGTLPDVFKSQVPIYQLRHDRKARVLAAFAEPALIFLGGVGFLMPILTNLNRIRQASSPILAATGYMVTPLLVCFVVLSGFGALSYGWLKSPVDSSSRRALSSIWVRLPLVSRPSRLYAQAMFCRYLGLSIKSGMNIFDSIALSMEASNDARFLPYIPKVCAAIEDGLTLEDSLRIIPFIHPDVMDYVGLGEETGRMSDMLMEGATRMEQVANEMSQQLMGAFLFVFRLVLIFTVLGFALIKGIFSELLPALSGSLDQLQPSPPSTRPPGY